MNVLSNETFDFEYFIGGCVQLALTSGSLVHCQATYLAVERDLFPPPATGESAT